ncbi:hypothetical protein SBA3_1680002 [Candidatus Sulfopaludibacter sp. SbA3]|nr:hypothetical protein SBA3_1680002 [Candidatus Sulfopaludibacter sp. SbA3]
MVACSWWLLLRHGATHVDWLNPLQLTWIALGLLPGKIVMVRTGAPLPVELSEEHYHCQDVARRNGIRQMDAFSWFFVVIFFGYALRKSWTSPAMPWLVAAASLAIMAYLMITVFR